MSLKKQAISGVKWNSIQQLSVQLVNFIVQVILARLLMPEMFGLIAMVMVFISIGQTLMDSGMTSSLIRTREPDQLDYSTVFFTNLGISIALYCLIFLLAPYVSVFYEQVILTDIIRLLALSFVIRALVAVHVAKLTKEMNFKLQMKMQIPSVIISGSVGVILAYLGYGVWSLVWLNLTQALIFTLQSWLFVAWKPSLVFDRSKFKYHFEFGYKLTLASLVDTVYNDAYRIVIGKLFSPTHVGYFHQAETMRLFPVQQVSAVMSKVTYPYFSNIDDDIALRRAYKKTMKLVMFVTIPAMLSLILIAEEGFRLLFGEKWLPAVEYFQILAIASIVRPVSAYNLNILKVKGRSDLFLTVEVIKKVLGILFLVVGLYYGLLGLVISLVAYSVFSYFINMLISGKFIRYSMLEQLTDISIMFAVGAFVFSLLYILKEALQEYYISDLIMIFLFAGGFILAFFGLTLLFDKELKKIVWSLRK